MQKFHTLLLGMVTLLLIASAVLLYQYRTLQSSKTLLCDNTTQGCPAAQPKGSCAPGAKCT